MLYSKDRKRIIICVFFIAIVSAFLLTRGLSDIYSELTNTSCLSKSNQFQLFAYPQSYTIAMSSTPGIKISAQYSGKVDKFKFSTNYGKLICWGALTDGKISELGKSSEVSSGIPVYWTPLLQEHDMSQGPAIVKVEVIKDGKTILEKKVIIGTDDSFLYTVQQTDDVIIAVEPKTIESAVTLAIKEQTKGYLSGEFATEGHVILKVEEKDGITTAYTIASCGWFGFENSIFTKISGSGVIPTVISFTKNENGHYILRQYKEPMDGEEYMGSFKKMFPKDLYKKVLNTDNYPEILKQQEEQAKIYLQSIGSNAKVSGLNVEKIPIKIDVQASNKLLAVFCKYDSFLNNCPYWIGTKQMLENGQRYTYQTKQSKTTDGYDLIIFTKSKENGDIVEERKYKIVGHEPVRIIFNSSMMLKSILHSAHAVLFIAK